MRAQGKVIIELTYKEMDELITSIEEVWDMSTGPAIGPLLELADVLEVVRKNE